MLPLTRAEFEQLISADIDRAVSLTESVLFQADTIRRVDDPVTIHLTGGSSNIPLVRTRLAALGVVGTLRRPQDRRLPRSATPHLDPRTTAV